MRTKYEPQPCEAMYPHLRHEHRVVIGEGRSMYRTCPGIRIPRASRAHQPRVRNIVLGELQYLQDCLARQKYRWRASSEVWEESRLERRPRRISEFPENSESAWFNLLLDARELAKRARELEQFAIVRLREVEEFNKKNQ